MPYIKSDRPPGRPRKYPSRADEPARLSLRISHALSHQLKATAQQQQTSVAAVVTQVLERSLSAPADVRTVILAHVATALQSLLPLEQAVKRSAVCQQYLETVFDALASIELELDRVSPQPVSPEE